jgi:hypothetical protein
VVGIREFKVARCLIRTTGGLLNLLCLPTPGYYVGFYIYKNIPTTHAAAAGHVPLNPI